MDEQYKYVDESLTGGIAKELIVELFKGKTVSKQEIVVKVDEVHLERGGKKATTLYHPVTGSLTALKRKTLADNPIRGTWHIFHESVSDESVSIEEDGVKQIGSGRGSVYLYYYPTYKKYAELKGEETWVCKIGSSQYPDPVHRIRDQMKTGMPESPEIPLVIRVNQHKKMETAIQKSLPPAPDAPGKEWFLTNPSQVEEIYNRLIQDYS